MDEARLAEIELGTARWPEGSAWGAELCAALREAWAERDEARAAADAADREWHVLRARMTRKDVAYNAELRRLRDALEAYCARCPNCRGKGRKAGQEPDGRLSECLCGTCGWAQVALGKA